MANCSKIRKVIDLDDDSGNEPYVAQSMTVPAPTRSPTTSTSSSLTRSAQGILSPRTLLVARMDLHSRGDLKNLNSLLLWNFGGKVPSDLDAVTSPFGVAGGGGGAKRRMESFARSPSPRTKNAPRNWSNSSTASSDEPIAPMKRGRESLNQPPTKRLRPLPTENPWYQSTTKQIDSRSRFHTASFPPRQPTKEEMRHTVIELVDDSDDDELIETSSNTWIDVKKHKKHKNRRRLNEDDLVYDLDELDDSLYDEITENVRELSITRQPERRNQSIELPLVVCETALTSSGCILKPGQLVQLTDGNFLHIVLILKNAFTGERTLRGHSLVRTSSINGVLPRKLNELVWQMEVELDDDRPFHQQSMTEEPLSAVLDLKELRITNQLFPTGSFRDTGGFHDMTTAKASAPCTMRWKYTSTFLNAGDRRQNRWHEKCLQHIRKGEIPKGPAYLLVDDIKVRFSFRGNTTLGGAYGALQPSEGELIVLSSPGIDVSGHTVIIDEEIPSAPNPPSQTCSLETVDLTIDNNTEEKQNTIIRGSGQKYTYGDAFCGAGGATRGAVMAGLKVIWGFDINEHACSSWQLNFPTAEVHEISAHDFCKLGKGNDKMKVDILHLSPPCQFFSPAHTVPGKDDELNSASLFACGEILDIARPRIATLEQTFGIIALPRFQQYFNALVNMFTCKGYSIRWRVALLQDWGLPQRRQRLIMIASCPGEPLPEFPPFTHCDTNKPQPGRRPWISVNSVLDSIPINAPDHDLASAAYGEHIKPRWSGTSIAPRCITTHGGHNYHPSGERGFTNREFAALQGFPHCHVFSHYNVKKQIGNAVPPSIAKVLFESIRKWLEKVDGVKADHFQLD